MSNEMIERVAKGLEEAIDRLPFSGGPDEDKIQYEILAKAAIAVMREPSEEMIKAAWDGKGSIWKCMIDAALKDD